MVEQVKRLKELEQENSCLRKVVSDLSIYNAILKEAPGETGEPGQTAPGSERTPGSDAGFETTCVPCVGAAMINARTFCRGQDG